MPIGGQTLVMCHKWCAHRRLTEDTLCCASWQPLTSQVADFSSSAFYSAALCASSTLQEHIGQLHDTSNGTHTVLMTPTMGDRSLLAVSASLGGRIFADFCRFFLVISDRDYADRCHRHPVCNIASRFLCRCCWFRFSLLVFFSHTSVCNCCVCLFVFLFCFGYLAFVVCFRPTRAYADDVALRFRSLHKE